MERWPSGRRRTPGKCVYGNVSRVRIPLSPPKKKIPAKKTKKNNPIELGMNDENEITIKHNRNFIIN